MHQVLGVVRGIELFRPQYGSTEAKDKCTNRKEVKESLGILKEANKLNDEENEVKGRTLRRRRMRKWSRRRSSRRI